jgi:spore germination cell wall hydrolase CwlJ-like protein
MSKLIPDHLWAVVTIFMEAEGESFDGKVAVAEVIWKRTQQKFFSDGTVAGTCLKPYQFSGWNTKSPNRLRACQIDDESQSVKDCIAAWDEAINGSNHTKDAVFYLNPAVLTVAGQPLPTWADPDRYVCTIGHHDFYRT